MTIFFNTRGAKYKEFNNTSAHGIEVDGAHWRSVEHYVQAQRFLCKETQEIIRKSDYAFAAKVLARTNPDALRDDWEEVRDAFMEKAVRAKFQTHPQLCKTLCATGGEEIIEASAIGTYWGVSATGTGQNKLGKILMKVRSELQTIQPASGARAPAGVRAEYRVG